MPVVIKQVYQPAAPGDSYRVLVDRLWPRGLKKEEAHVDAWLKDVAPSPELRRWFNHDAARWDEFCQRYRAELAAPTLQPLLADLRKRASNETVTLLYAAADTEHNQALVLQEVLAQ